MTTPFKMLIEAIYSLTLYSSFLLILIIPVLFFFRKLKRIRPVLIVLFMVSTIAFLFLAKPIILEGFCNRQARKVVKDNWDLKVPIGEAEIKQVPWLFSTSNPDHQITWGFKEQLKCERERMYPLLFLKR